MFVLLGISFLLGIFSRRFEIFPGAAPHIFNRYILCVCMPAMVVLFIKKVHWNSDTLALALIPWAIFATSILFFYLLKQIHPFSKKTLDCLIVMSGVGNAFIGLPMIDAFYGKEGVALAVLAEQGGTLPVFLIVSIFLSCRYCPPTETCSFKQQLQKVILFPPMIGLLVALLLLPFSYPASFEFALGRLYEILIPLGVFSVGFQLKIKNFSGRVLPLLLGLSFKMLIAPLCVWLAAKYLLHLPPLHLKVIVQEAATPPTLSIAALAVQKNLHSGLARLMLAIGILASFITMPLIYWFTHAS